MMRQKTIWMLFLGLGVYMTSIVLKSCSNEIVEPIKTVQYVYKNTTDANLVMDVYSQTNALLASYDIAANNQIVSHTTKAEGPAPFYYDSNINGIGDSIVIKFSSDKCLFWVRNKGDRIFTVAEYDNYSTELLEEQKYQLEFSIKQSDLNLAVDCK